MSTWFSVLLEIIKLTIPALAVFFTVYYMLKMHFKNTLQMKQAELRRGDKKTTLPLRLQAYERLSLFCERISIPNMILRLRSEKMTVNSLKVSMLLAIQKEFEHNITQQVYVSEQLWEIIKLARDETVSIINAVAEKMEDNANGELYAAMLFNLLDDQPIALDKALSAIKKEAAVLLQ